MQYLYGSFRIAMDQSAFIADDVREPTGKVGMLE
jgi:hypothetical protein